MTAITPVPDLGAARDWYAGVFDVRPYFDQPFYVGFDVAGFELGLVPEEPPVNVAGNRGVTAYWGVADLDAAHARFLAHGATELHAVTDVGGDIRTSVVTDPYGNAIGLIQNPHFRR